MAHHVSGLGLGPTSSDPRSHITDLYVFQTPGDATSTVLAMNINPNSPFTADAVDPESVYEIGVDTNGDAINDIAFRVRFSPVASNTQTASLQRADGVAQAADINAGETIFADAAVTFGESPQVTTSGEYKFFVGLRSDPFFADPAGAANNFQWTGVDAFADKNVFGIVLQVPNTALGDNPKVGIWSRVLVPHDGQMVQGDRAAQPGIDATFNQTDDDKRVWNMHEPSGDRKGFLDKFAAVFENAGHYSKAEAMALAEQTLPDLVSYDYTSGAGFPNGRNLTDDVINLGTALVTNGAAPNDGLHPHDDLRSDFPYEGDPH